MEQGRGQTAAPSLRVSVSTVVGFGLLLALLFGLRAVNFLLFHTLAEMFSVVVAFAACVVAWYSRDWIGRNYLLLLGLGQLFIGAIDTIHTLGYKGIALFDNHGGSLSSQLWMSARTLEGVCFLVAVWSPSRRYRVDVAVAVLAVTSAAMLAAVFGDLWPATFIEGQGVTPFKTAFEFGLAGLFVAVLLRLRRQAAEFDPQIYSLLLLCVWAKIATEVTVAWYVDVYGITNFIAHTLKILGAWLFLKAVVDSGLRRPQALIFGALERERTLSDEVARHATTLDAVLAATLDPVIMFDAEGRVRFASTAAERFLGRTVRELVGRTWREAGLPDIIMLPLERVSRTVMEQVRPHTEEITVLVRGNRTCLELQAAPVADGEGEATAVVAFIRDITARKAMEESLQASLDENRVLMMEVHHRVKNNLQIVSSILQMQGWRMTDPALKSQFEEACGRILALAKVHELLYTQDSVASLDFALYIRTLCAELFRIYEIADDRVLLSIDCEPVPLAIDQAEPLALVVHELVSNALKHAFRERGGTLRVGISAIGAGEAALVVADDGANAARIADFAGDSAALGMRMVGVLVKQIHGTVAVRRDNGTEVEVRFPLEDVARASPRR